MTRLCITPRTLIAPSPYVQFRPELPHPFIAIARADLVAAAERLMLRVQAQVTPHVTWQCVDTATDYRLIMRWMSAERQYQLELKLNDYGLRLRLYGRFLDCAEDYRLTPPLYSWVVVRETSYHHEVDWFGDLATHRAEHEGTRYSLTPLWFEDPAFAGIMRRSYRTPQGVVSGPTLPELGGDIIAVVQYHLRLTGIA